MLVLRRDKDEAIIIDGNIRIVVLQTGHAGRGRKAEIGIEAPPHVKVRREGAHEKKDGE